MSLTDDDRLGLWAHASPGEDRRTRLRRHQGSAVHHQRRLDPATRSPRPSSPTATAATTSNLRPPDRAHSESTLRELGLHRPSLQLNWPRRGGTEHANASSSPAPRSRSAGRIVFTPPRRPGSSSASTAPPRYASAISRSSRRKARSPCRRSTRIQRLRRLHPAPQLPRRRRHRVRRRPGAAARHQDDDRGAASGFATRSTATLDHVRANGLSCFSSANSVPSYRRSSGRGSRRQGRSVTRCRPSPADPGTGCPCTRRPG